MLNFVEKKSQSLIHNYASSLKTKILSDGQNLLACKWNPGLQTSFSIQSNDLWGEEQNKKNKKSISLRGSIENPTKQCENLGVLSSHGCCCCRPAAIKGIRVFTGVQVRQLRLRSEHQLGGCDQLSSALSRAFNFALSDLPERRQKMWETQEDKDLSSPPEPHCPLSWAFFKKRWKHDISTFALRLGANWQRRWADWFTPPAL